MSRRRTYFVPLCVLSGFFLLSAIACGVMSIWAEDGYDQLDHQFAAKYSDGGSYQELYREAFDIRHELSEITLEFSSSVIGHFFLLGFVLLGWALDRRRLVKKLSQSSEC